MERTPESFDPVAHALDVHREFLKLRQLLDQRTKDYLEGILKRSTDAFVPYFKLQDCDSRKHARDSLGGLALGGLALDGLAANGRNNRRKRTLGVESVPDPSSRLFSNMTMICDLTFVYNLEHDAQIRLLVCEIWHDLKVLIDQTHAEVSEQPSPDLPDEHGTVILLQELIAESPELADQVEQLKLVTKLVGGFLSGAIEPSSLEWSPRPDSPVENQPETQSWMHIAVQFVVILVVLCIITPALTGLLMAFYDAYGQDGLTLLVQAIRSPFVWVSEWTLDTLAGLVVHSPY